MRSVAPLVLVGLLGSCAPPPPSLAERIEASLARATGFLVEAQDEDGAWRSRTYGALKDGWSLTASCSKALAFGSSDAASDEALARGLAWLASGVRADGTVDAGPGGLPYPVYTAALAVVTFTRADPAHADRWRAAREGWLRLLRRHQLDEDLGWSPDDPAFGGWSYALEPPRVGEPRDFEADLSSTLFALGALRLAGVQAEDALVRRALSFVERCQNLPLAGEAPDPARDDGGFFMSPTVELQDKAGGAWTTAGGRRRFASYGTMTADGLRALLRCGLPPEHPRVKAALAWLAERFDPARNPGEFEAPGEVDREGASYYWRWSVAHALVELGAVELATRAGPRRWAADLAEDLLARQRPDGSWSNPITAMKEDDPLVATPFAMAALALCRLSLAGSGE